MGLDIGCVEGIKEGCPLGWPDGWPVGRTGQKSASMVGQVRTHWSMKDSKNSLCRALQVLLPEDENKATQLLKGAAASHKEHCWHAD